MTEHSRQNQFAQHWPVYAQLKPVLRSHITFASQRYRGQRWFVLHDALTGKHLRVNTVAYEFLARLDGQKTVGNALEEVNAAREFRHPEALLSREDTVLLLMKLQEQGGTLKGIGNPSSLLAQAARQRQQHSPLRKLMAPLAIKLPLLDPDAFLDRIQGHSQLFFGRMALLVWSVLVCSAMVSTVLHWDALHAEFASLTASPHYLLLMWFVYPILKVFHEFSHAIMVKRGGGEVHEMGITLLVFTPVPYVDASAAWAFKSRTQRMLVSAVGIMAELLLASLALLIWAVTESGLVHDLMFVLLLVGSVSTVVFNANPLLKFDGYYVLQDWLEIPNLYQRSQHYLIYLIKRFLLFVDTAQSPVNADGERFWFVLFGVSSLIYRNVILLFIALWLVGKLLLLGVAILGWVVWQQYTLPLFKAIRYLLSSDELAHRRFSRAAVPLLLVPLALFLLAKVPLTYSSRVQGIVWVSEQAQLFAANSGVVEKVFAQPGQYIQAGDAIVQLAQPELDARISVLQAQLTAHKVRRDAEVADRSWRANLSEDDIAATQAELQLALRQQQALLLRAQVAGTFVVAESGRLIGRYYKQGDLIGHIVNPQEMVIRVVIPEHQIGAINEGVVSVAVRLAERFNQEVPAYLSHQTPSANNRLPSAALGSAGGGGIAIAAADDTGTQTRERVFHLELSLAEPVQVAGVGERAFVSLRHKSTPLADRLLKSTRQLFLKHLPDYTG